MKVKVHVEELGSEDRKVILQKQLALLSNKVENFMEVRERDHGSISKIVAHQGEVFAHHVFLAVPILHARILCVVLLQVFNTPFPNTSPPILSSTRARVYPTSCS